jgi:hypothetical protein
MPTVNDANGMPVKITDEGSMKCYSVIESEGLHVNEDEEEAYTVQIDVTPATTDDDFFYLRNTDARELVLSKISGWAADANQIISVYIGGTSAGTDAGDALIPANLNAGSANTADCDCTQDVTDLAIPGGRVVRYLKFSPTALTVSEFNFESTGLILPKNQRLHLQAAIAGNIRLQITFYYHV